MDDDTFERDMARIKQDTEGWTQAEFRQKFVGYCIRRLLDAGFTREELEKHGWRTLAKSREDWDHATSMRS